MTKRVEYVTTAIVYPNSKIHVGFAWECLGADWYVRCRRALGNETFFATGVDEHSLNVQRAAEAQGLSPQKYCDQMAADITAVLKEIKVDYNRFIRTSDEDHKKVVAEMVQRAFDKGDIYQAKYEGHYCDGCEAFYTDKDLVDGICPKHKTKTKWLSEDNYFFKLSKYQDQLLKLFEEQPQFLQPESRRSEVLNFIKAGLKDFSVSRSTLTWGIPLPHDPKHVVYVWFDALFNYVTAAKTPDGDFWPAALHVIGKDITRFHCVFWPAMLMSVELPLPKRVFGHGFINLKGEKMSKSTGNMVHPDEVVKVTGCDPFRYYLLAENHFSKDGNYDFDDLVTKNNSDLSNDWGNLVNRSISMTRKYFADESLSAPDKITHSEKVRASFESLVGELEKAADQLDPAAYAKICRERSRLLNLYIDETKPWKMAKEPERRDELKEVMFTLLEGIRWTATAFRTLLPEKMPQVYEQLNVPKVDEFGCLKNLKWGEHAFQPIQPSPIYPRLNQEG